MWPKKSIAFCLLGGTALSVIAMSCADYLTGQLAEPDGPLLVTRLTVFDNKLSRDIQIFTDTSLPDCKQYPADFCAADANRISTACRICYNDVLKDAYSVQKSPPTPDSGGDMRVVFNKIPQKWNGATYSPDQVPDGAVRLECDGCLGVPPYKRQLDISGSTLSYDPRDIPYGPSLHLSVDRSDPRSALEPDTSFRVYVDAGLADRNDNKLDWQSAASLLRFKTEPMKVLRIGRGDETLDSWVYASTKNGDGSTGNPYSIADLARDSAIVLRLNASIHPEPLATLKLTGSIKRSDGTTGTVDVLLGTNIWKLDGSGNLARDEKGGCIQASQRYLYLWPDTPDLRWPSGTVELALSVSGSSVKDVGQVTGFPVGKHTLATDATVRTRLLTTDAPMGYAGLLSSRAKTAAGVCTPAPNRDLGAGDGGNSDLGGDMSAKDM
jgi:hypothetical protein